MLTKYLYGGDELLFYFLTLQAPLKCFTFLKISIGNVKVRKVLIFRPNKIKIIRLFSCSKSIFFNHWFFIVGKRSWLMMKILSCFNFDRIFIYFWKCWTFSFLEHFLQLWVCFSTQMISMKLWYVWYFKKNKILIFIANSECNLRSLKRKNQWRMAMPIHLWISTIIRLAKPLITELVWVPRQKYKNELN